MAIRVVCPLCDRGVFVADADRFSNCAWCGGLFAVPSGDGPRRWRTSRMLGLCLLVGTIGVVGSTLLLMRWAKELVRPAAEGGPNFGVNLGRLELPIADEQRPPTPPPARKRGRFTIGKQTTRIDGPLDDLGHIDYTAALNAKLRAGVTPETNAAVRLWDAIGPGWMDHRPTTAYFADVGLTRLPRSAWAFTWHGGPGHGHVATTRPWRVAEFPSAHRWLIRNGSALEAIRDAAARPHYFTPQPQYVTSKRGLVPVLVSPIAVADETQMYLLMEFERHADALLSRAMLRLATDEPDEAWADLIACHRLARHIGRDGLVGLLYWTKTEKRVCEAELTFLKHAPPTAARLARCRQDLRELPALLDVAELYDVRMRYTFLGHVMKLDKHGPAYLEHFKDADAQLPGITEEVLAGLDLDPVLIAANLWFDRMAAAARETDAVAHARAWDLLDREMRGLRETTRPLASAPNATARGEVVADMLVGRWLPVGKVTVPPGVLGRWQATVEAAVALAHFRLDTGRDPAALADLVPKYMPAVPPNVVYQRTATGYDLRRPDADP